MTRALIPALLFFLAACSAAPLYTDIGEEQANEMLVILDDAGIGASKSADGEGRFALTVDRGDFADAIAALNSQGYPREDYANLGEIFKKEGFVDSEISQRARLMYGLSQELSRTLTALDGVVVARVHLAIPQHDPLADTPKPSSASVLVKHRAGVDMSGHIGEIKALVVNGVEGLSADNVTVAMFPAEPFTRPRRGNNETLAASMGVIALLLGAVGLAGAVPQIRKRFFGTRGEDAEGDA
ncbi:type III secretion inner membrane ring lipoprotein SctJ [Pacificimonas sp. WHA3]|uniref:Lipoprotein n=1 Tax=Pacificimonas pallii TaxID=2827236 RepID=A0ABS6SFX5_9SPHN|nr:type III secretion inner membrane ring lipoprotein SctJ [Pacificimonas pallii]MBV7256953.1 type III secretion inner membrane ring lipoprotein SctJ [Pacificimonas pallii]